MRNAWDQCCRRPSTPRTLRVQVPCLLFVGSECECEWECRSPLCPPSHHAGSCAMEAGQQLTTHSSIERQVGKLIGIERISIRGKYAIYGNRKWVQSLTFNNSHFASHLPHFTLLIRTLTKWDERGELSWVAQIGSKPYLFYSYLLTCSTWHARDNAMCVFWSTSWNKKAHAHYWVVHDGFLLFHASFFLSFCLAFASSTQNRIKCSQRSLSRVPNNTNKGRRRNR